VNVNTDVTVRILVFALALIAIVLVANTKNNMANIFTILIESLLNSGQKSIMEKLVPKKKNELMKF